MSEIIAHKMVMVDIIRSVERNFDQVSHFGQIFSLKAALEDVMSVFNAIEEQLKVIFSFFSVLLGYIKTCDDQGARKDESFD